MRCAYKSYTIWSSSCNPNFKQIHLSNQSVKIFPRTSLSQLGIPLSNAYRVPLLWPSALYPAAIQRLCLFSCFVELAFPSFERIIMQSQCTTAYQIIATIPSKTSRLLREICCRCILLLLLPLIRNEVTIFFNVVVCG